MHQYYNYYHQDVTYEDYLEDIKEDLHYIHYIISILKTIFI